MIIVILFLHKEPAFVNVCCYLCRFCTIFILKPIKYDVSFRLRTIDRPNSLFRGGYCQINVRVPVNAARSARIGRGSATIHRSSTAVLSATRPRCGHPSRRPHGHHSGVHRLHSRPLRHHHRTRSTSQRFRTRADVRDGKRRA